MILGLTGSVGSGKSTVADMLRVTGQAEIIDADAIVHELQQPGQACLKQIADEFGKEILLPDGSLDRGKLAGIVFENPERLERLNAIIHPLVWQTMQERVAAFSGHPLVVLMVPLLYEIGADKMCGKVIVVTVSEAERERRLMKRDGLTRQQIDRRLDAQMPQKEKETRADFVIDNSGTPQETLKQVNSLVSALGLAVQPTGH